MRAPKPAEPPTPPPSFEQAARLVLSRIHDAFAAIVEALPERITRASHLSRALDLDRKLAWKFSRLVATTDPFALVDHLPGGPGVEIFLAAAERREVPAALIEDARHSFREFERLIEVHAGDRASLEMMARAFSREASEQSELNHRKAAFTGNSYTWGVQARTQLSTNVIAPSQHSNKLDIALISGLIDLRRLRPKVAWVVARMGFVSSEGKPQLPVAPGASKADKQDFIEQFQIPLLEEFCSASPTDLRAKLTDSGLIEIELIEGPVGDTSARTYIFSGQPFRGLGSRERQGEDSRAHHNAHVRTPSTMLIHDLFVHKDVFGPIKPEAAVFSEVHREVRSAATRDERYRLPVRLTVEHLGRGAGVSRTPDVPKYPQVLRQACKTLGWDSDDFDLYRLSMAYPIVPSAVVISFELPESEA